MHYSFATAGPVHLLVLQSTPFCNIDCSYCYLPDRRHKARMTEDIIHAVADRILRSPYVAKELSVLWHAGEPLTLPVAYYRGATAVLSRAAEPEVKLSYKIQSNGTLLSNEWCEFLNEQDIEIGISLDGPALLHDLHRRDRSGSGTFAKVRRGIDLLKAHSIPFHILAVLTRDALDYPREIFDLFEELEPVRVSFNLEEIEGANRTTSLTGEWAESKLREFIDTYWDLISDNKS